MNAKHNEFLSIKAVNLVISWMTMTCSGCNENCNKWLK
jgi:hypothetical protein